MADVYRRTLDELITRYTFHPEMRDLYVEGPKDRILYGWYVSKITDKVRTYCVDEIFVDNEMVLAEGVATEGNKGRVIAAARRLSKTLATDCVSALFVADRDFHDFGFPIPDARLLALTDMSCVECYSLQERSMKKMLSLYAWHDLTKQELQAFFSILNFVFLARRGKQRLAPTSTFFSNFTKLCKIKNGSISFDKDTYLDRLCSSAHGAFTKDDLLREIKSYDQNRLDHLTAVNGHDAAELCSWLLRLKGTEANICSSEALTRAMMTSIEMEDLQGFRLFELLNSWAS